MWTWILKAALRLRSERNKDRGKHNWVTRFSRKLSCKGLILLHTFLSEASSTYLFTWHIHVRACMCRGAWAEVRGQLPAVRLLLLSYVGPGDGTQVTRSYSKDLYPLSHPVSPLHKFDLNDLTHETRLPRTSLWVNCRSNLTVHTPVFGTLSLLMETHDPILSCSIGQFIRGLPVWLRICSVKDGSIQKSSDTTEGRNMGLPVRQTLLILSEETWASPCTKHC